MIYRTFLLVLIGVFCMSSFASSTEARLSDSPLKYYPHPWKRTEIRAEHMQVSLASDEFKPAKAKPRELLVIAGIIGVLAVVGVIIMPRD